MRYLSEAPDARLVDKKPFVFRHNLTDHPSLSLEGLARIIPELPSRCLGHSQGLASVAINFDRSFQEHKSELSLLESFERLKEVNSYITIMDPMEHPAFSDLYRGIKADVEDLQKAIGRPGRVYEGRMWLFIASPNAVTPFHFDRYSNFLMQIQGSKEVAVFPNFREDIVPARALESYMDREPSMDLWRDELDAHALKFDFRPGETLHIPFSSGHYVKNGPGDVSVSLSFFFQTDETNRWVRAMRFNNRVYRQTGLQLKPVKRANWRDEVKASTFRVVNAAASAWLRQQQKLGVGTTQGM